MKKLLRRIERKIARYFIKKYIRVYQQSVWVSEIELSQARFDVEREYRYEMCRALADKLFHSGAVLFEKDRSKKAFGMNLRARLDVFQP